MGFEGGMQFGPKSEPESAMKCARPINLMALGDLVTGRLPCTAVYSASELEHLMQ